MKAMKDYYKTLEVSPDADGETIKRAYKRLARQCHPDICCEGSQRFMDIQEAYRTLSDRDARAAYDRKRRGVVPVARSVEGGTTRRAAVRDAGPARGFRGMGGVQEPARHTPGWGDAVEPVSRYGNSGIPAELLSDPCHGAAHPFRVRVSGRCMSPARSRRCRGSGRSENELVVIACPWCGGRGRHGWFPCFHCGGAGLMALPGRVLEDPFF